MNYQLFQSHTCHFVGVRARFCLRGRVWEQGFVIGEDGVLSGFVKEECVCLQRNVIEDDVFWGYTVSRAFCQYG